MSLNQDQEYRIAQRGLQRRGFGERDWGGLAGKPEVILAIIEIADELNAARAAAREESAAL